MVHAPGRAIGVQCQVETVSLTGGKNFEGFKRHNSLLFQNVGAAVLGTKAA